jgi:non-specific serine/threonine protein kinase
MDERAPADIPSRIGDFTVLRLLGEGGMGRVYLAHDPKLDRRLAIKVLPERLSRDADRLRRLNTEARLLASLNHPNVATIYDLIEDETGRAAVILEFIEGESLDRRLGAGPLPLDETLSICRQIALALEATHERGLLHLDLKPGNVMVTPKGLVKLLDFGLARSTFERETGESAEPLADTATLSPSSPEEAVRPQVSGTPGYMSPEQIRGLPLGKATDTFAFGCILFECLSGKRAFAGRTVTELLVSTMESPPQWALLPTQTPPGIRSLLARCLEPDAGARIQDVTEARAEIEKLSTTIPPSDDTPAGTPPQWPKNLPVVLTSFVGRVEELRECADLLASSRLLTLTGPGGCGKTRLAQRIAVEAAERFPNGVYWIDLASLGDPARVPQVIAAALGVEEDQTTSIEECLARHLRSRDILLLLDNCEHLLAACVRITSTLLPGAPHLRILATSRERLNLAGEQDFPVGSLALPVAPAKMGATELLGYDSIRLFLDRAHLVQPAWKPSDGEIRNVAEICRRLDGIPLAIELAAARLRVLSVEQIVERLHQRLRLLSGGATDGLTRHQTLQATLDWSYGLLDPVEQRFLRSLSAFAGGWTLAAATSVCGVEHDEFAILDLHARLVDKSLIVVNRGAEETRYRFLETVQQYARDRLDREGDAAAVLERHLDFYVSLLEQARPLLQGPRQAYWLRRLDAEHENILAALDWAAQDEARSSKGLRIVGSMSMFWEGRGHSRLGRATARRLLECGEHRPTHERAIALTCAGNLAWQQNDYPEARRLFEEGLGIFRTLKDANGVARALGSLGLVSIYQGDYEAARGFFEETLGRFRELGDRLGTAKTLGNLAIAMRNLGDRDTARRLQLENLAICLEIGNARSIGIAHHNLAVIALEGKDFGNARIHIREAIQASRDLDDPYHTATIMERMSELLSALGRMREAVRFRAASAAIRDVIDAPLAPKAENELREFLEAAHAALGDEEFTKEWETGTELSPDVATREAIDLLHSLDPIAPATSHTLKPR